MTDIPPPEDQTPTGAPAPLIPLSPLSARVPRRAHPSPDRLIRTRLRASSRAPFATPHHLHPPQLSPLSKEPPSMLKKLLAGVITAVLSLGAVALIAGPASAHHNTSTSTSPVPPTAATRSPGASRTPRVTRPRSSPRRTCPPPLNASLGFSERKQFLQFVTEPQDLALNITGSWVATAYSQPNSGVCLRGRRSRPAASRSRPGRRPRRSVCDGPNHFTDPSYSLTPVTGVAVHGQRRGQGRRRHRSRPPTAPRCTSRPPSPTPSTSWSEPRSGTSRSPSRPRLHGEGRAGQAGPHAGDLHRPR